MSHRPSPPADPLNEARALITRYLFGTVAVCAIGVALLWCVVPADMPWPQRATLVGAHALLALCSLLAMRWHGAKIAGATCVVMLGVCVCVVLVDVALEWGLGGPVLGLLGLVTCMVFVISGVRLGLLTAVLAVTIVALLAGAAILGAGAAQAAPPHFGLRVFFHLLVIGAGVAGGALVSMVVSRYVRASDEREKRFRSLLGIAADAYWETDSEHRVIHYSRQTAPGVFEPVAAFPLRRPWAMDKLSFDPEATAALRSAMHAHEPFREIAALAHLQPGESLHVLISGEPQRDGDRRFSGFWGVIWDVSDAALARQALSATETRWRDLFTHLPTPIVLHRRGIVVEANPAALALFGFADPASIVGFRLLDAFDPEAAARAASRLAQLDAMPIGQPLPIAEFRIRSRAGLRRVMRGTGVRVDTEGEPATLSFFVDETERKISEERLRNSESLLSHLVETSPDLIMLSDVDSGRFTMVNESFVRLTGWSREEAVGRGAADLGLWSRGPESDKVVAALRAAASVQDMPVTMKTRTGGRVALRLSAAKFTLHAHTYMVINARDVSVTERERLEREAILDSASIGIAFTRDQRFVLVNRGFETMHGWPHGALVNQAGATVWPSAQDHRDLFREISPALEQGETVELERTAMRRDGSTYTARLLAKAVDPSHPIQGGTIWIVEDVTERRSVERALASARDEAEAASRAKSAFLANTSHEIRTPLNALLGLARLARAPGVDEARRNQYVEQICDSAETLSQILTDILDLSKIEAGKMTLDQGPFDLRDLLAGLHQAYASLADAKGLRLDFEADAGLPDIVIGDPVRVRQILSNFLHNALKFTKAGSVRWRVVRDAEGPGEMGHAGNTSNIGQAGDTVDPADMLRFEVIDTGPGVDPQIQPRLFRPFTQADDSVTRRYGGTGLGLSICRELAQMMGGEVGMRSEKGRGSCFWARLPLPPAEDDEIHTTSGGLHGEWLNGASMLLVEDNAVNMMIAVAMLEQWGVQVEQAVDGQQAIDCVERAVAAGRPFDLVLMDVQMPIMSGNEATIQLRRRYSKGQLPIVALTAAALVSEREQALAAGMNEFITKPIDPSRLRTTITRVLAAVQDA